MPLALGLLAIIIVILASVPTSEQLSDSAARRQAYLLSDYASRVLHQARQDKQHALQDYLIRLGLISETPENERYFRPDIVQQAKRQMSKSNTATIHRAKQQQNVLNSVG
ncbi:hypothetical protein RRG08_010199 [Elysia crispata]|uniref:Uncharacterized protein n=1 Tax=Elysia crispata TaxID=231223 RepID=A0AAE1AK28_9GAST|nr:hypothetical protein RRG08_010199 [Elysia crispata]